MLRLILLWFNLVTLLSLKSSLKRARKGVRLFNNNGRNPSSGAYDFNQWKKAFISQPNEFHYTITDIKGKLPNDLSGTLFRAMPGLFERGSRRYGHYLDGDGYIIKLTISNNGTVTFRSKFVNTEEYKNEKLAGKVLYRSTFRTQRDNNIVANGLGTDSMFLCVSMPVAANGNNTSDDMGSIIGLSSSDFN